MQPPPHQIRSKRGVAFATKRLSLFFVAVLPMSILHIMKFTESRYTIQQFLVTLPSGTTIAVNSK